jgi:hypothetical protein
MRGYWKQFIPVYAIPHPSGAWGLTNENREVISRLLAEVLANV